MPSYKASQFIDAIPGSAGIVSTIARRVGCAWHTAKKHIDQHPTVQEAYQDEVNQTLDITEAVILRAIKEDDVQTAKWYLTMKGRERGYASTERHEVTGADGEPIILRWPEDND